MTRLDETVQRRVELVRRVEREETEDAAERQDTAGQRALTTVVERVADKFLGGGAPAALPAPAPDPTAMRAVVLQVASDPQQVRGLMQTDRRRFARVFVDAVRGDPELEAAVQEAIVATMTPPEPPEPPEPPSPTVASEPEPPPATQIAAVQA